MCTVAVEPNIPTCVIDIHSIELCYPSEGGDRFFLVHDVVKARRGAPDNFRDTEPIWSYRRGLHNEPERFWTKGGVRCRLDIYLWYSGS